MRRVARSLPSGSRGVAFASGCRARTLGNAIRPIIERLEPRRFLAGFEIIGKTLTYISDDTPQVVRVRAEADKLRFTADGRTRTVARSLVRSIRIVTGDGADEIRITAGLPALVQSGAGNDLISAVARGAKGINGGLGDDTVRTGSGDDYLAGGEGDDCLLAADGNDTLVGGGGRDKLYGQNGDDHLEGNADADRLLGGDGRDTLSGNGGNDRIDTGPGSDIATGGAGGDKLFAVDGDDTLRGGLGNDTLYAGPGQEVLRGDEGVDQLSYHYGGGGVNVAAGQPVGGWSSGDSIDDFESLEVAQSAATLSGSSAGETLLGNSGDDSFEASGGDDLLDGATGEDTATFTGAWRDYAITESNGAFELLDERIGSPDGRDVVRNVERFAFEDGDLTADELLNVAPVVSQTSGGNVNEDAVAGTAVAVFSGSDANALDSFFLSLIDDAGGRFTFHSGSGQLRVVDPMLLNFEAEDSHVVTLRATDARGLTQETDFTISINDVNEPPALVESVLISSLDENTDTTSAIAIVDFDVIDDALGSAVVSLSGADAAQFEIVAGQVRLIAGASLDFEVDSELDVTVNVDDTSLGGGADDQFSVTLSVNDVNEAPSLSVSVVVPSLDENIDTSSPIVIAEVSVLDDALGSSTLSLTGADAGLFEITGGQIQLIVGASLDRETNPSLDVTVRVDDPTVGGSPDDFFDIALTVNDINEPPMLVTTVLLSSLSEDADTSLSLTIAELSVLDDALGTAELSLGGTQAALFEIVDGELRLTAGASIDHETAAQLSVTVLLDDSSVGASPDDSASFTVTIDDVNEAPTGGSLSASSVNENASNGTSIGTVTGVDVDDGDTLSYALTDDAAGRFAITSAGLLSVADGTLLDFETATSHDITVRVSDAAGLFIDLTFTISLNNVAGANYSGTSGADTYSGGLEPDTINGNNGNDSLSGGGGNDTIDGGGGNDTVSGDAGNDSLIGGSGTDWAYYSSASGSVIVDLSTGTATGQGTDSLATFENVRGSSFADTLTGSSAGNFLDGWAGNDSLNAGNGNDSMRGGSGSDTLNGGAGTETVYYDTDTAGVSVNLTAGTATQSDGVDTLISIETLYLSAFADTVVGSSAATTIFDDAGNDSIDGGGGNDTLYAMGGNDTLAGGSGTDRVDFNSALGSITASLASGSATSSNVADGTDSFSGFEQMRGSNAGSDSLTGSSAANTLLGSGGNDTLTGGGGNDSLSGDGGTSDVAVFTGNWADYTITVSGANYQLIDTRSGSPDGTDLVSNTTERFQFANGKILAAELINVAPSISGISSSTVPELSATGTVVGTVSATDTNSLDTRTFALSDNAGGRFQIDASSGVVSVLDGTLLVIAVQATHSITVTVTDIFGLTATASFTITLTL